MTELNIGHHCFLLQNKSDRFTTELLFLKQHVPSCIFLVICFVIGVTGNAFVLYIFYKQFKQSNYRVYVLFLSGIDIVFCFTVLPFYVFNIIYYRNFNIEEFWRKSLNIVCKLGCFMTIFLSLASLIILVIIAVDRYIVVRKPSQKKIGEVHALKSCIIALLLSGTLSWYSFLIYGVNERWDSDIQIVIQNVSQCTSVHKLSYINNYILLACSLLQASFFSLAYGGIWSKIKIHAQRSSIGFSKRRRTIMIYIAITAVFSISTIISLSLRIVTETVNKYLNCQSGYIEESAFMLFSLSHCINHVSNPIIYYWRDIRFRNGVKRTLCCWSEVLEMSSRQSDTYSIKSITSKTVGNNSIRRCAYSADSMTKASIGEESSTKKETFNAELSNEENFTE